MDETVVDNLKDLQIRNIRTKPELWLSGVFILGDRVFELLSKLVNEGKVKGVYFSHYCEPPKTEPHAKVGIRYRDVAELDSVSFMLDSLCDSQKNLVTDKGRFEKTLGVCDDPPLPADIVVDYIACHSFEFLLQAKGKLGNDLPRDPGRLAHFILDHRAGITNSVINAADIFRDEENVRPLIHLEMSCIWERFVHHLLNAYKVFLDPSRPSESYEATVKRILLENGIICYPYG